MKASYKIEGTYQEARLGRALEDVLEILSELPLLERFWVLRKAAKQEEWLEGIEVKRLVFREEKAAAEALRRARAKRLTKA